MLCQNCKMSLPDSATFCPRCGRSVEGVSRNVGIGVSDVEAKEVTKPRINYGYSKMKYYKMASIICTIAIIVLIFFSGDSGAESELMSLRIAFSSSRTILLLMGLLSLAALGTIVIGGLVYVIKAISAGDNPISTRFIDAGEICMKTSLMCDAIVVAWLALGHDVFFIGDIILLAVLGINGFVLMPRYKEGVEENRIWKKKYEGSAFAASNDMYK